MKAKDATKNLAFYANNSEVRSKKDWGRKTHSNKEHYTRVKCHYCDSEGCKACEFSGLITIK